MDKGVVRTLLDGQLSKTSEFGRTLDKHLLRQAPLILTADLTASWSAASVSERPSAVSSGRLVRICLAARGSADRAMMSTVSSSISEYSSCGQQRGGVRKCPRVTMTTCVSVTQLVGQMASQTCLHVCIGGSIPLSLSPSLLLSFSLFL